MPLELQAASFCLSWSVLTGRSPVFIIQHEVWMDGSCFTLRVEIRLTAQKSDLAWLVLAFSEQRRGLVLRYIQIPDGPSATIVDAFVNVGSS